MIVIDAFTFPLVMTCHVLARLAQRPSNRIGLMTRLKTPSWLYIHSTCRWLCVTLSIPTLGFFCDKNDIKLFFQLLLVGCVSISQKKNWAGLGVGQSSFLRGQMLFTLNIVQSISCLVSNERKFIYKHLIFPVNAPIKSDAW